MLIPIDEVVHFDAVTHDPATGNASDADSTPTYDVFEEATDTPILDDQNFTKRTSLTGNYRGSFTASAANGFEAGKWYNVVASATVGGVSAKKVCAWFRVAPAESAAGVPKVDLAYWLGVAPLALASQFVRVSVGALDDALLTAAKFASGAFDAVWSVATRLLTAGTNIVLAKGTGLTGLNDLSAAQVNAEADTALADYDAPTKAELDSAVAPLATAANLAVVAGYLDTEIAAIKGKTDNLPASPAATGDIPNAAQNAAAVLLAAASAPVAANVKQVNDVNLQGDGSGTPWGPV